MTYATSPHPTHLASLRAEQRPYRGTMNVQGLTVQDTSTGRWGRVSATRPHWGARGDLKVFVVMSDTGRTRAIPTRFLVLI